MKCVSGKVREKKSEKRELPISVFFFSKNRFKKTALFLFQKKKN